MADSGHRYRDALRHPRRLPAAALRRAMPNSARYGFPWVHLPDGSVTFREAGFVAAASPSMLLARHNHELSRIHRELDGGHFSKSLELGCGFGRLSAAIAEHSAEHIAVDISGDALEAARTTYPRLDFLRIGPGSLPFANGVFDLIVTWTVLQHVRPERIAVLCNDLRRVLSSDGLVLICEETRDPDGSGGHTWHRTVNEYADLFAPLRLLRHGEIEEIADIPGMESPGEVMVFEA